MIRLISWNVNRRTTRLAEQVKKLEERQPDIVALQEVTVNTVNRLREELTRIGLPYIDDTTRLLLRPHWSYYCVLTASRWPLRVLDSLNIIARQRVLSVQIHMNGDLLELHNAYLPLGGKVQDGKSLKIETLEAIYHSLARSSSHPRILCGDFNTPQRELPDGKVMTFGQYHNKQGQILTSRTIGGFSGLQKDQAERNILTGLAQYDLADVYRQLHGYNNVEEYSWYHLNRGRRTGFRLDHIFASASLNPVECRYLHDFREAGLSDHSPIEAVFVPNKEKIGSKE